MISIYILNVNVVLSNRTSDLPFYTMLLHFFGQYSLPHAHNRARSLRLSAQGENARQNLLFIMNTYGRWTEEDLDRALTALQNGDAGLSAIAKTYGVPKATLKKNILTAATNMLMVATLKSAILIPIC